MWLPNLIYFNQALKSFFFNQVQIVSLLFALNYTQYELFCLSKPGFSYL